MTKRYLVKVGFKQFVDVAIDSQNQKSAEMLALENVGETSEPYYGDKYVVSSRCVDDGIEVHDGS